MTSNVPTVPAMPSLQCTSCTRLKSGRDSLQLLVADCQRKLLDSQRELLEERIEKQQMQNELGDLQVELEVIMTELALYRSRATAGDKTARESKDCQTDAVPSEPIGTLTLAAQERTKITKYRDGTGQLSLIDLSSSSQSRSSSSSRGTRIVQYVGKPPPQSSLTTPKSTANAKSNSRASLPRRITEEVELVEPEKQLGSDADLEWIESSFVKRRSKKIDIELEKQLDSDTDPEWTESSSAKHRMKKTDKEMKFVKQQEPCSSQLTSPSQSSKRKAEAEIALPYGNDDRAATLKKLKFTRRGPPTSPPKIMTAVASTSTWSSDPAPKQNSSPPSLPKFQSSPSQLTFRAHLKSLRSSMPSHVPQSPSGWAGFPLVQIRRDLLNNLYGMGTQQLLVRIARDRNPLPPFTSRSSDRHVIFPNLDRNPLPQKRGDPGFIITARLESAMTLEQCSLFIKTSSKVAIWDYLGEYKLTPSGKIGGKFGTQWYNQLETKVRKCIEKDILAKAWHRHYRERIADRLRIPLDSVNIGHIKDAMLHGEEEINLIALECIGYDEYFANDMLRRLGQAQSTADSKGNTNNETKPENKNEGKKLRPTSVADIQTKPATDDDRIDVDNSDAFADLDFYDSDGELTQLEDD